MQKLETIEEILKDINKLQAHYWNKEVFKEENVRNALEEGLLRKTPCRMARISGEKLDVYPALGSECKEIIVCFDNCWHFTYELKEINEYSRAQPTSEGGYEPLNGIPKKETLTAVCRRMAERNKVENLAKRIIGHIKFGELQEIKHGIKLALKNKTRTTVGLIDNKGKRVELILEDNPELKLFKFVVHGRGKPEHEQISFDSSNVYLGEIDQKVLGIADVERLNKEIWNWAEPQGFNLNNVELLERLNAIKNGSGDNEEVEVDETKKVILRYRPCIEVYLIDGSSPIIEKKFT